MADTAGRTVNRARRRRSVAMAVDATAEACRGARTGTRHPLVAAVMVLPMAILLTITFGGWEAVVTQASSVAGMLGR
ncbi:hypothetical protein AB0G77_34195 [Streptomyces hygroscopicus]|uniref:Integral membrane protein n=1 Tax=Streptomyces hygroscopicus TaxID=1912 RepID=A0ABQ3UAA2_STRHY|nr:MULTISPECIES: hypothetical protein [Streptomyces]MDN3054159.1 hypothetical protein [Streptomyces sp. SRF1]GHJ32546.1 hypothetical protein TPA0910_69790 [Streptomyces hygroscopicus]